MGKRGLVEATFIYLKRDEIVREGADRMYV
jgi:hypothetical protein